MSRVASSSRFFEPLENRQLLSLVVDLRLPGGGKTATATSVGQVINMEIWATAKGGNTSGGDEGLQIAVGSLLSTNVNGGAVNGTLKATLLAPFNALGSNKGTQKDLDGDGDLDVGSNNVADAQDYVFARSASMTETGTVSGASKSFKIGTATFTVTSLKSTTGQTNLNWRTRHWVSGALWQEDNSTTLKNGLTGSYSAGSPIVVKRSGSTTLGSISGKAFKDADKDGALDSGEAGFSGLTMYIDADRDGIKDTGERTATTDSAGNYTFGSLAAGSYRVREVVPSGYKIGNPSSGYHEVTLTSGQNSTGKNFANQTITATVGSIAGKVVTDTDGDGSLESGEPNRSGVKVFIDKDRDGVLDAGEPNVTTGTTGTYKFSNLAAGSYQIRIVKPSGYRISTPSAGYHNVTVSGNNITNKNFGVTQRVLISGRVWVDADKDNVKDSSETALAGWTVYIDKDKDGRFDVGENSVKTDSSGNYTFKQLPAGSYRVRILQPTGYTRIAPSSGYYDLNNLGTGSVQTSKNFRFTKP